MFIWKCWENLCIFLHKVDNNCKTAIFPLPIVIQKFQIVTSLVVMKLLGWEVKRPAHKLRSTDVDLKIIVLVTVVNVFCNALFIALCYDVKSLKIFNLINRVICAKNVIYYIQYTKKDFCSSKLHYKNYIQWKEKNCSWYLNVTKPYTLRPEIFVVTVG